MLVCIAGKNNIAVDALEYMIENGKHNEYELCVIPNSGVVEDDGWQKSLIKAAKKHDIPIVSLTDLYEASDLVFISLQYEKIIKPELFKSKKLYNMHFAPLPKYKGYYTSILPILNGETQSGVTIHEIDKGIDTGDIISQRMFPIGINETERDLYFNYMMYGLELFKETVGRLLTGDYKARPQGSMGATIAYARDLDYKNPAIDLKRTSYEIHNRLRAFIFPEFQLPKANGYSIVKSVLTDERISPGVFNVCEEYIEMSGIDGYMIKAFYQKERR